jgi:CheY-like chemotaxis protein
MTGEPSALREVLVNLVLNAVEAMPSGGRVEIRTWAAENAVHCRVADTGMGMSAEVQRRAFEPFFTTKDVKSTGLGLSVSYGIIQRHGGELMIESHEGRGAAITFSLPVSAGANGPIGTLEPEARRRPLRILLIDDEAEVRALIQELLEEDGHQVIAAASGPEGVAQIQNDRGFDLVLTDLGMPGMTGGDVARAVKATNRSLVVGIVTGWGHEVLAADVRACADFIVTKPVTQNDLRGALAHAPLPRGGR